MYFKKEKEKSFFIRMMSYNPTDSKDTNRDRVV